MRRFVKMLVISIMVLVVLTGCQKSAEDLREAGMWEERNKEWQISDSGDKAELRLWLNAKEEMTEEDRQEVIDYYLSGAKDNSPVQQDNPSCYAVFYKEKTDEVLKQYKYVDGEAQTLSETDKSIFKLMDYQAKALEEEDE